MTAAIASAFFIQAAADCRISMISSAAGIAGILGVGLVSFWVFGLASIPGVGNVSIPFGENSMNLLAPFWPQTSGLFDWTGVYLLTRGSIGATRGQYEGYCYLGAGNLLLIAVALKLNGRALPSLVWRHWALCAALTSLTIWACSNRVYLGNTLILSYPVPDFLLRTLLSWFRSEGRMFWPVAWLLSAAGIAGAMLSSRPRTAVLVGCAALLLQWIDLSTLRSRLRDLVHRPVESVLGNGEEYRGIEAKIKQYGRVTVVPSRDCTSTGGGAADNPAEIAATEMQLMAARANAMMENLTMARNLGVDCAKQRVTPLKDLAVSGVLLALTQPGGLDRTGEAREKFECRSVAVGWICIVPKGDGL